MKKVLTKGCLATLGMATEKLNKIGEEMLQNIK